MTIELITSEEHAKLMDIFNKYPALRLQNNGYEYLKKDNLTEEDNAKIKEIEEILKKSIEGFVKFSNFRLSNQSQEIQIRFQYHYSPSFTGVGYILLDELLNGFRN